MVSITTNVFSKKSLWSCNVSRMIILKYPASLLQHFSYSCTKELLDRKDALSNTKAFKDECSDKECHPVQFTTLLANTYFSTIYHSPIALDSYLFDEMTLTSLTHKMSERCFSYLFTHENMLIRKMNNTICILFDFSLSIIMKIGTW